MALTADQQREAMRRVMAWRAEPARPIACPACERPGLEVIDRSARPRAEWYALNCPGCGLAETLHIPMGAALCGLHVTHELRRMSMMAVGPHARRKCLNRGRTNDPIPIG